MEEERNLIETMHYSPLRFGQKLKMLTSVRKDTVGKGTTRGLERHKFQHRSSLMSAERNLIETENFDFGKKGRHRKGQLKRSRMAQISVPLVFLL